MAERVEPPRKPLGLSTLAVHGGEPRPKPAHSLATPIVQTATYTFANTQELKDHFDGKIERVEYGRYGNPTQRIAEAKLAALEGAGACLLFASGMGAMTTALFAMLSRGTHVVVTDDSYRRTRQFLNQTLHRYGIEVSTVPAGDYEALEDAIRGLQGITGATVDPFAAYLLVRGLKTFALRMERQNTNAQAVAEFLTRHPRIAAVHYAGLPSHPEYDIAKKQMRGFGGVVSFEVAGDLDTASRVVDACTIPHIAASLGGVESLIEQPAIMSFYELTSEERLQIGIKDTLIRYAVGIEDADDLIADLDQALDRAFNDA